MPSISPPAKVLVTGASGFLAVWVEKTLLERGFNVRGTVRSHNKGDYLRNLFEKDFPGKFEYVIVEDIAQANAFDEAVKDVDGIAHIASPVVYSTGDPDELIKPAVSGSVGLIESAHAHGQSVKRIVVTSSVATLAQPHEPSYVYGENDWNDFSVAEVRAKGISARPDHKYRASKVLAERAVWDYVKKHEGNLTFDVVTVLPPSIYGPILHEVSSLSQLNRSAQKVRESFVKELPIAQLAEHSGNFIDVRDAAELHCDALTVEEFSGHRLIASGGPVAWQDFYDAANSLPPSELASLSITIPKGIPGIAEHARATFPAIGNPLGRKLRPLPVVVRDMLLSLDERKLL